jgi:transmembrane 9 superfamily protein 2/4
MTSGTSCIYMLIYGFVYSQLYLKLRGASVVVFMGYVVGIALVIAIITGCSGFLATFVFVKYIYNQIKSEYLFAFMVFTLAYLKHTLNKFIKMYI